MTKSSTISYKKVKESFGQQYRLCLKCGKKAVCYTHGCYKLQIDQDSCFGCTEKYCQRHWKRLVENNVNGQLN
ncbi:MAG: hypothetical protein ACFFD4_16105 [Candidatus Odinarchaeota archaeon]